jgi:hypothetical protein
LADISATLLLYHEPLPDFGCLPERNGVRSLACAGRSGTNSVGATPAATRRSSDRIAAELKDRTVGPAAELFIDHARKVAKPY